MNGMDRDEPRLIQEVGLEAQIASVVESVILSLGFRLIRVYLSKLGGLTVQIMVERKDECMTVMDCELVSRMLSPVLDVENLIDHHYNLEISSPGIDRPLVRYSDFIFRNGCDVKVTAKTPVDGQKKFRGSLLKIDTEGFILKKKGSPQNIRFSFKDLAGVRLVLTDSSIRAGF